MISHVSIKDFAIIKDLSIDLYPGLNIITGETGSGKSIIIEAVSMALGSRADSDYIRSGADKATVTIIADGDAAKLAPLLETYGVPSDMPMVLHREISTGRSLCRVNGSIVPLGAMSRICRHVADIHGQYDHQSLLDTERHIDVLDLYGGEENACVRSEAASCFERLNSLSGELARLRAGLADSARQKELFAYELSEIEAAAILPSEDEKLAEDIALMQHSEQIYEALAKAFEALFADGGASESLSAAMSELSSVSAYSKEIDAMSETVSDAYYRVDELSRDLRRLRDGVSFSQEELEEKLDRLAVLDALKRKYGGSLEKVTAYADKARASLEIIENADAETARLESELAKAKEDYIKSAEKLNALRRRSAAVLEEKINEELTELAFSDSFFKVEISPSSPSDKGSDAVEFLISTNKGEPARPLAKIASGGELSRVMLAMKGILVDMDSIPTMIFDEIDTGISGAVAGTVGEKLERIAAGHQVVCITHLPQIACRGMHHFRIAKFSDEYSTTTSVVPLSPTERIEEIARLLSGSVVTEAARQQARILLSAP